MKKKLCQLRKPTKTLGLILLGAGALILAAMLLPPVVWVFVAGVGLICGGIVIIKK